MGIKTLTLGSGESCSTKTLFTGTLFQCPQLGHFIVSLVFIDQHKVRRETEMSKQGIMILSQLVESYKKGQESAQQLEREKFAFEQWKAAAKAIGWIFERLGSEE